MKTVPGTCTNTEPENQNIEEDGCGPSNGKISSNITEENKGKKKHKKNKNSKKSQEENKKQMESEKMKRNTRSTTAPTKNSDNEDHFDADRTVTDGNTEQVPNDAQDNESNDIQPTLDPSRARRSTRKRKAVSPDKENEERNETMTDVQAEEKTDDSFHCHICKKCFVNYNDFRAHKIKCWPTVRNVEKDLTRKV